MREKRLMKRLVVLLFLFVLCTAKDHLGYRYDGECQSFTPLKPRPHSVSVLEFGAVGDGKTLNTLAFQNAIFYLKSFADKGGAQLYVPAGKWLTGNIKLTSHLTLFLEKEAIILGTQKWLNKQGGVVSPYSAFHFQPTVLFSTSKNKTFHRDFSHWDIVEALPSYGRGIEVPGRRYGSLITGNNLVDVVITGNNGTIDGQGSVWWEQFNAHSLNYSRPHLVELIGSSDIVISNLTFLNAPAWNIRPVYCSNVLVQNVTVYTPSESPYTNGIVPDSSDHVCIESSNISTGYDAISLKSGWDEYGIAYDRPTADVHIRGVHLQSTAGSGVAFGSEMSGGISNILVERLHLHDSFIGVALETSQGRGGYIEDILISDVIMDNVQTGIRATGQFDTHPDDKYDPSAFPVVKSITFKDIVGTNISIAGSFSGIYESPFTKICLSNISISLSSDPSESWICSNVSGFSENVLPEPCPDLQNSFSNTSSTCFSPSHSNSEVAVSSL